MSAKAARDMQAYKSRKAAQEKAEADAARAAAIEKQLIAQQAADRTRLATSGYAPLAGYAPLPGLAGGSIPSPTAQALRAPPGQTDFFTPPGGGRGAGQIDFFSEYL